MDLKRLKEKLIWNVFKKQIGCYNMTTQMYI